MRRKCIFKCFQSTVCLFTAIKCVRSQEGLDNNRTQSLIEEAGCPYQGNAQFLQIRHCLMPNYLSSEPPKNVVNKTLVDGFFEHIRVLKVHERDNKITLQINQYMEWQDERIMSDFSSLSSSSTRLAPNAVDKIWHPNIGTYTHALQDWESLYDPYWYERVCISEEPLLRNWEVMPNISSLFAWKDWRATLFCDFDFSNFPLDTQSCEFRQSFPSGQMCFLEIPKKSKRWNHITNGYKVKVIQIGSLIEYNNTLQNGSHECGFNLTLDRILQPYLLQYYFPSMAIVGVSLISFIIPLSAIPGRVALIATQFLTMTNIFIHLMVSKYVANHFISLKGNLKLNYFNEEYSIRMHNFNSNLV